MNEHAGEKTEQPTPRRLEEAIKSGQIARSAEVQTVLVLLAALAALAFAGQDIWQQLIGTMALTLGHLHDTPLSINSLQGNAVSGTLLLVKCVGPVVLATMLGGLLAGAIQNRFQTASEVLTPNWERINPVAGFQRIFSGRMVVPTAIAVTKFTFIVALTWSEVRRILNDPIFTTSVSTERLGAFVAQTSLRIILRVTLGLILIAAADYGYQWWRTQRDLMMTRQEVKDDLKNSEGNPRIKAARRRRRAISKARALAEVPKADVVVTNPTHIAVALRYDRKTMRAPKVVAKGVRLNAQRIREIAQQYQVPLMENKPLARMLFKHGRVGSEIPAHLYAAVAEVLAWVYRINRYRYYAEQNQV
ncbi:MAG TPA: EscU/YscU/HrcU family type III secretion system export apparatus switch protein [Candidatus Sulfopaludibacter sp.]|nr:EscU/YscU/HrcU family type III secretion system export apparatus switch protein [Candidatus Sulfopaludibacter sp.]